MTVLLTLFCMGVVLMLLSSFFTLAPTKSVAKQVQNLNLSSKDNYNFNNPVVREDKQKHSTKNERINKRDISKPRKNTYKQTSTIEVSEPKKEVKPNKINKIEKAINKVNFIEVEKNALSEHQDKIIKLLKNEENKKNNEKVLTDKINEIDSFRNASTSYEDDNNSIEDQDYKQMFENIINPNIHNPLTNNDNSFILNFKKEELDSISKEFENMEVKKLKTFKRKTQIF